MRLESLQREVQEHVLARGSRATSLVSGDADAAERLAIYVNAYTARLAESLAATYPHVRQALGPTAFACLCARFAREHPSTFPSVRDYGEAFPAFLFEHHDGVEAAGLCELAEWDWACASAFDAADVACLTPTDLSLIAPERWPELRFSFHPSLRRLRLTTNAMAWVRGSAAESARAWRREQSVEWLVWRRELTVYFRPLETDEARVLDRARCGACFGEVCADLLDASDADAASLRAASLLRTWQDDQLLIAAA